MKISRYKMKALALRSVQRCPKGFEFSVRGRRFTARRGLVGDFAYAKRRGQWLRKNVEFHVRWQSVAIPVAIRMYETVRGHSRIFAYTAGRGLLLSLNFSTAPREGDTVALEQRLTIISQNLTRRGRLENRDALVNCLAAEGFTIEEPNTIIFGHYDFARDKLIGTGPNQFVRDFVKAALIKGHFMANKGYSLPFL